MQNCIRIAMEIIWGKLPHCNLYYQIVSLISCDKGFLLITKPYRFKNQIAGCKRCYFIGFQVLYEMNNLGCEHLSVQGLLDKENSL